MKLKKVVDSDDDEYYYNEPNYDFSYIDVNEINKDELCKIAIDFYNKFINNNINNNMINRYSDKNYIKLYRNYKMNFNL